MSQPPYCDTMGCRGRWNSSQQHTLCAQANLVHFAWMRHGAFNARCAAIRPAVVTWDKRLVTCDICKHT